MHEAVHTLLISSTLLCFFSSVFSALSFLVSYMRVPAACGADRSSRWRRPPKADERTKIRASSSMERISIGFMFSTFVMRPCMMRKCGLLTLSCTEWKRF